MLAHCRPAAYRAADDHLATLQAEASTQLTEVDPARLTERFLSWARARS
ncbi:hypothetical protein AB0C47_23870 [Micromonospora taraxaci]